MMDEIITLQSEDGQSFTGTEILGLTLDEDLNDIPAGSYIMVIQDEEDNLYPFVQKDDNSVELIQDEEILDTIQTMLDLLITGSENEES